MSSQMLQHIGAEYIRTTARCPDCGARCGCRAGSASFFVICMSTCREVRGYPNEYLVELAKLTPSGKKVVRFATILGVEL